VLELGFAGFRASTKGLTPHGPIKAAVAICSDVVLFAKLTGGSSFELLVAPLARDKVLLDDKTHKTRLLLRSKTGKDVYELEFQTPALKAEWAGKIRSARNFTPTATLP
jgi:hypothetical protein